MAEQTPDQIVLPERLISSIDLSRLIRELERLDESLRQAELRKAGEATKLARSSVVLEELARANNVQLTDETQRAQLLSMMQGFKDYAPRVRMSLATEPSAKFTQNIVIWMRKNINPLVLLEVGLQPTLAAGCMVRTNNKIFDMSLRHRFNENRAMLVQKITEISEKIEAEAAKAPTQAPAPAPAVPATAPALPATSPPQAAASAAPVPNPVQVTANTPDAPSEASQ